MPLADTIHSTQTLADLYEKDYYRWLLENARLLRAGRLAKADAQHIAEELEDMGRSERRALASYMGVLLLHLLKWQFQPDHRNNSWRGSIYNTRRAVGKLLSESPSLHHRVADAVADEYPHARFNAANETGWPESAFPVTCPYTTQELLAVDYWPD